MPAHWLTAEGLRAFFRSAAVHDVMAEAEEDFVGPPPRQAAVLVPVIQRAEPTVLLTQRTAHLRKHAGQIAFPGGKMDEDDASPTATALREAEEEVGLLPSQLEVIGSLPRYNVTPVFSVTPVVALVQPQLSLRPNPNEVAEVFEVPLGFLMNPANHRRHAYATDGVVREWFSMPYADPRGERYIWGVTAAMLHDLYRRLSAMAMMRT
ncbi:MAG TPA: CoA pyrophosphatase [Macromonas sp.]|nr:CoA pyrophosphatase [Macromonas sp.]